MHAGNAVCSCEMQHCFNNFFPITQIILTFSCKLVLCVQFKNDLLTQCSDKTLV